MDGRILQQIRDSLLIRREQLEGVMERGREREREAGVQDLAGSQAEMIDMAQALEQIDRDHSLHEQERRELMAIERALGKVAVGTFGTCEECEEEIPAKRLMVRPEARLCAKCQAFEEKQQGRLGRGVLVAAR